MFYYNACVTHMFSLCGRVEKFNLGFLALKQKKIFIEFCIDLHLECVGNALVSTRSCIIVGKSIDFNIESYVWFSFVSKRHFHGHLQHE